MNILGQSFDAWVTKQINFRQASLKRGSGKNADDLKYQQSKTPWIRLASSINVNKDGGNLAKNLILQGGVRNENGTQRFDITPDLSSRAGGAYGWGGDRERGYVPMPGITNASVKFINNGALSKSEITIKCYSKEQFALIDALYMRPGYTLLLEFGWSVYLDNNGNLTQYDGFSSPALRSLFKASGINQYDIMGEISKERVAKFGNYEGVFGKVSNFKWNFNPDGSYECIVNLVGLGDVLETLKINVSTNDPPELTDDPEEVEDEEFPLVANATKTTLNQWLFKIFQTNPWGRDPNWKVDNWEIKDFPLPSTNYKSKGKISFKNGVLHTAEEIFGPDSWSQKNPLILIPFGMLIAWLQKNILLSNKSVPGCAFDMNFEKMGTNEDQDFIFCPAGNFSSNPRVCLIPFDNKIEWAGLTNLEYPEGVITGDLNSTYKSQFRYDKYNGRLSQVLISLQFISETLQTTPIDDDGVQSLLEFLKGILSGISKSLGGINNLTVKLSQDQSKIRFIEETPMKFESDPPSVGRTICKFNTFAFNNPNTTDAEGSFIRNITLDGSIPSNFATMITIGAQSNGNQTGGNATSFSQYNAGLVDRIIPVKTSTGDDDDKDDTQEEKEESQVEKITKSLKKITTADGVWDALTGGAGGVWEDVYGDRQYSEAFLEQMNSLHTQYIQLLCGYIQSPVEQGGIAELPAPFFLPFNFSMDIDGMSGITLYERFKIDDKVLPPQYSTDDIDILVKGTNHTIDGSAWTTTLETQSTPAKK